MHRDGRLRWLLGGGGLLSAGLFFMPLPDNWDGPAWAAIGGTVHVAWFAGLAGLIGSRVPARWRGWPGWLCLAGIAGLIEGIQPWTGRSAELADWLWGAAGSAGVCLTWARPRLRILAVTGLCLCPAAWETILWRQEAHAFPVLADPGAAWSRHGWTLNGVDLRIHSRHFRLEPVHVPEAVPYPGIFRHPAGSDWRGMQGLELEIFWGGNSPATFAVRVDDRGGSPAYADRFQREFSVEPGWNRVAIPATELGMTPGGRPLNLAAIEAWGVFLVSDVPFDYVLIGPVHLAMQQEPP